MKQLLTALALSTLACTGSIGGTEVPEPPAGGGGEPTAGPARPGTSPTTTAPPATVTPGPAPTAPGPTAPAPGGVAAPVVDGVGPRPLARLTPHEYHNTVRDLLGVTLPDATFESEQGPHGYDITGDVSGVVAASLQEQAEEVALAAVKNIAALVPCAPATGDAACARAFISTFGRRAFRRTLLPAEQSALEALFNGARTTLGYDFTASVRVVITAVLQTPQFNYHWELAGPVQASGGVAPLSGPERASRLSYFLWASMPDDELLAAAESGALATAAGLEKQARRMLASPRARRALADMMARQWLHLDGARGITKQLPDAFTNGKTGPAMAAEASLFVGHALFEGGGKIATLLTAPWSFVNDELAKVYGLTVASKEHQKVDLDPARRSGILTQGAFLAVNAGAAESSPVKRGKELISRVMCVTMPPPPDDIPPLPPSGPSAKTMRARTEQHAKDPACAGCHAVIDPPGFAFEHYDAAGRFRTTDGGEPIDASGTVTVGGAVKPFANAIEMTKLLAGAPEVEECFTRQFARYLLGRQELPQEEGSVVAARSALRAAGGNVQELLVALTQTRAFANRTVSAGEVVK